jgi:hypothetical protein
MRITDSRRQICAGSKNQGITEGLQFLIFVIRVYPYKSVANQEFSATDISTVQHWSSRINTDCLIGAVEVKQKKPIQSRQPAGSSSSRCIRL